jgi:hypothetical protein
MELSEAIRLGAMMKPQAFRALVTDDGACALGAALLAVGAASQPHSRGARSLALGAHRERELSELWPLLPDFWGYHASQRQSPLDSGADREVGRRDRAHGSVPEAAWREVESVAILHDQWARCSGGM